MHTFLEAKLRRLRRKTYEGKYDTRDKNLSTVLANSSNHSRARRHNLECKLATHLQQTSYFVAQKQILGDLKTYLAIEMSQYNASINFGYIWMNFGYFGVFWRIFFGYTGIPLPPLADPVVCVLEVSV